MSFQEDRYYKHKYMHDVFFKVTDLQGNVMGVSWYEKKGRPMGLHEYLPIPSFDGYRELTQEGLEYDSGQDSAEKSE